jgi:photosystem II protein PsbQ
MKATALLDINRQKVMAGFKTGYRSLLSLMLVAVAVFLVGCGGTPTVATTVQYTPAQLEQIQRYASDVQELRDRMLEIPPLVQKKRWRDVETFVHGPLGEIRTKMSNITRNLAPEVQKPARQAAQDFFGHLVNIDDAAKELDSRKALKNYNDALQDFDAFLKFIPTAASAPAVSNS